MESRTSDNRSNPITTDVTEAGAIPACPAAHSAFVRRGLEIPMAKKITRDFTKRGKDTCPTCGRKAKHFVARGGKAYGVRDVYLHREVKEFRDNALLPYWHVHERDECSIKQGPTK